MNKQPNFNQLVHVAYVHVEGDLPPAWEWREETLKEGEVAEVEYLGEVGGDRGILFGGPSKNKRFLFKGEASGEAATADLWMANEHGEALPVYLAQERS